MTTEIAIGPVRIGGGHPPVLIVASCVMEEAFHLVRPGVRLREIRSTGNGRILLTERGRSFGDHNLAVGMRGLVSLRRLDPPGVFDGRHGVQLPGRAGAVSDVDRGRG